MKLEIDKYYAADFETSVYEGQSKTEVWAASICEVGTEEMHTFNNLDDFFDFIFSINGNIAIFFHNLKFDGSFILNWLFSHGYHNGLTEKSDNAQYKTLKHLGKNEFTTTINAEGVWYKITMKHGSSVIEFRDSMKKINMSIAEMPSTFNTKHKKTSIEYVKERHANEEITDEETEYITNDVYVLDESLDFLKNDEHFDKLTTGAMALAEFKDINFDGKEKEFRKMFPNMCYITQDKPGYTHFENIEGCESVDDYIRKSYRGGWCYVNKYKEKQVLDDGCVCDVNSLYPSMMHSSSGNRFPIGYPKFGKGKPPEWLSGYNHYYYFLRVRCNFILKDGYLPFIEIKDNIHYKASEILETSYMKDKDGNPALYDYNEETGKYEKNSVVLTLSMTDWELLNKHYIIKDLEYIDYCYFNTVSGIFDAYINKWAEVKKNSKGGMRYMAKLFLNSLYGKFGTRPDDSFKIPYMKDGKLAFYTIEHTSKETAVYIPIAAAITSYARRFTITAAQANYHKDGRGFVYADTDSIHCDCDISEIRGVSFDDVEFNNWKIERTWEKGYFVRAKTYLERKGDDLNVKAAGMPPQCKEMFANSLIGSVPKYEECNEMEKAFYYDENKEPIQRDFEDFDIGLSVPGKLIPKQIEGGCVLADTDFTMKEHVWEV